MELPRELPKRPVGWTKKMAMHLNFGGGKGSGVYKVFDPAGLEMPIGWMYRQEKKSSEQGFTLPGLEALMSWDELREMWPVYLRKEEERKLLEGLDD